MTFGSLAVFRQRFWGNAVNAIPINRQTDDQLEAILAEAGHWAINGQQGTVLSFAGNLQNAIGRAASYTASGAVVVSIVRLPSDNIVVSPEQIIRLRKLIAGREVAPAK
jgi:hypothetical protein